jgi:hypothetical protein
VKQSSEIPSGKSGRKFRFSDLVALWADRLGRHQVPLREECTDINDLLSPDAVHHELIQDIVRRVYCVNGCGHLNAGITLENTFTALGRVRQKLLESRRSDVDQINLLDNIGWYTRQYFGPQTLARDASGVVFESAGGTAAVRILRAGS